MSSCLANRLGSRRRRRVQFSPRDHFDILTSESFSRKQVSIQGAINMYGHRISPNWEQRLSLVPRREYDIVDVLPSESKGLAYYRRINADVGKFIPRPVQSTLTPAFAHPRNIARVLP